LRKEEVKKRQRSGEFPLSDCERGFPAGQALARSVIHGEDIEPDLIKFHLGKKS
jgi:hypothetical protein